MIAHLSIANLATLSGSGEPPAYSWTGDENPVYTEFPGVRALWENSQFFVFFSIARPEMSSSAFILVQMIDPSGAVYRGFPGFVTTGEIEISATDSVGGRVMFQLAAPSYPEYFTPRVTARETNPVRLWPAVNGAATYNQTP